MLLPCCRAFLPDSLLVPVGRLIVSFGFNLHRLMSGPLLQAQLVTSYPSILARTLLFGKGLMAC